MNESFDWTYPGLDWSQFHSLANLLSLRNGGQAESSFLSDVVLEQDWSTGESDEGFASSVGTHLAHQISSSGHELLKQKFLDCLAEFAANKKGGRAVACSAMEEAEDSVVVWIARNDGFQDVTQPVFDRIGQLLGSLADSDGTYLVMALSPGADVMPRSFSRSIRGTFVGRDGLLSSESDRARLYS